MLARRPVKKLRIAALASHPVTYQSHLYRLVAANPIVDLCVIFGSNVGVRPYSDAGFGGHEVQWDTDMLAGYQHTFLRKANKNDVGGFLDLVDWDVLSHITRDRYDVLWVHSFTYITLLLGIAAAKLRGIPVMMREEQTLLHRRPWWKAGIRALTLRALYRGTTGLAIGSNNRAYFRRYGVPEDRIYFVPYTTDNDKWQHEARRLAPERESIRASFGIRAESPVILFTGKLQAKKQPDMLLEAFRRVRELFPCTLLLVGTGELEHRLREEVVSHSIPDVVFAGFLNQSEIPRAYAAADVFVLPSCVNETWGMVVNEAMNFALPVVVSDKVGCAPDLVQNGDNGYMFDNRAVEELTLYLAKLVSDAGLRGRLGQRSLARITRWSPQVAADGLVAAAIATVNGNLRRHPGT